MTLLEQLRQRTPDHWLVGQDSQRFLALAEALAEEFAGKPAASILIADADPVRFLAGFLAAQGTAQRVFLGNPHWGTTEWQQALALAQPDLVWGDCPDFSHSTDQRRVKLPIGSASAVPCGRSTPGLILIPTGGSSGTLRFAMHRCHTLAAAVEGFQRYFQVTAVNSICVLPLYHVSGLMQALRSLLSGGKFWLTSCKALSANPELRIDPSNWFLSLVPTQLQGLLDQPGLAEWLVRCQTVFLGGAPSWPDLLARARARQIPLAPCYGMTETAAQIAALKPAEFLAGNPTVGQVLPHARVTLLDEQGQSVAPGVPGQVHIAAQSLALGYYPEPWGNDSPGLPSGERGLPTDDVGVLDNQGYLTLVGRLSNNIITGGEKVYPAEVEGAIRATRQVIDVAVLGMPDPYWGQCVTAVYVPADSTPEVPEIEAVLEKNLARFKRPKLWVPVAALPRNAQGKLNRQTLETLVTQWRQTHGV